MVRCDTVSKKFFFLFFSKVFSIIQCQRNRCCSSTYWEKNGSKKDSRDMTLTFNPTPGTILCSLSLTRSLSFLRSFNICLCVILLYFYTVCLCTYFICFSLLFSFIFISRYLSVFFFHSVCVVILILSVFRFSSLSVFLHLKVTNHKKIWKIDNPWAIIYKRRFFNWQKILFGALFCISTW
jgi:hypothetical protein